MAFIAQQTVIATAYCWREIRINDVTSSASVHCAICAAPFLTVTARADGLIDRQHRRTAGTGAQPLTDTGHPDLQRLVRPAWGNIIP